MHALRRTVVVAAFVGLASALRAGVASLTVYSDGLCKHALHTVTSPSTSLCYNSSGGDFIVTGNGDPSKYWASTSLHTNAGCAGAPVAYSASVANECVQYNPTPNTRAFKVMRMRGADFASVYQWNCAQNNCGACDVAVLKEGACARVNNDTHYTKPIVLGFGTGVFDIQFFASTDGTCQNPVRGGPTTVPDSTCYGPRKIQASSLRGASAVVRPNRP